MAGSLVPPQHGAWAFLGLPLAAGAIVAPALGLPTAIVAITWICAYPASYAILSIARARASRRPEPERFYRALAVWGALCAMGCISAFLFRPYLLWVGFGYGLAFAINITFARRRDERALVNDLVFIVECSAMTWVIWAVGNDDSGWAAPGPTPPHVWIAALLVSLALVSSTLQVKSLIRERNDDRYARGSLAFSVFAVIVAVAMAAWWGLAAGLWLLPAFAYFICRSVYANQRWKTGRAPRPVVIGMTELAGFVIVAAGLAAATYLG